MLSYGLERNDIGGEVSSAKSFAASSKDQATSVHPRVGALKATSGPAIDDPAKALASSRDSSGTFRKPVAVKKSAPRGSSRLGALAASQQPPGGKGPEGPSVSDLFSFM